MTNEEFIKSISLEGEEWRDVVGYEDYYMISSFGRVISKRRVIVTPRFKRTVPPHIKKSVVQKHGYPMVNLHVDRKTQGFLVHRLVALAFIPNPDNKPEVDHINTNRLDARVCNLRWCTSKENNSNTITAGRKRNKTITKEWRENLSKSHKGDNSYWRKGYKLTEERRQQLLQNLQTKRESI